MSSGFGGYGNVIRMGILILLGCFLFCIQPGFADQVFGDDPSETWGLMHFTEEEILAYKADREQMPRAASYKGDPLPKGSVNLMDLLPYYGSERDQGQCGNCWVWAGTGALEIEHTVNNGISDRLSVQYFNSNYNLTAGRNACNGGLPDTFARFYNETLHRAIPWSNTNASYFDTLWNRGNLSGIHASFISISPNYPIPTITNELISTQFVSNQTAIDNIKTQLNANRPVMWGYYLPESGWDDFIDFWRNDTEATIWNPDPYNGQANDGGHEVLIVGYNDTAAQPYWIVLNSWGVTANRTTGLMRLNMSMDYNGTIGSGYFTHDFDVLTTNFVQSPYIDSILPSYGINGTNVPFLIQGFNFTAPAIVNLSRNGQVYVTADDVSVLNATEILGTFSLPPSPGFYNVTVNQEGLFSNSNVLFHVISESVPVADFTANQTSGPVPLTVQFMDHSTGSPTSWFWLFGDGNWSISQNPVYTYYSPGVYWVNLTATNSAGSDSKNVTGFITATSVPITPPVADFTADLTSGPVPLTVQFTDQSTGSPASWFWQFGDGNWSTSQNPAYTYYSPGSYWINLTATNSAGSGSKNVTGFITATQPVSAPVANFTVNQTSGSAPMTVQFTDTSTGNPQSWLWEFGDWSSTTAQNPVHTYGYGGIYSVNLTASNSAGSNTTRMPNLIQVVGPSPVTPVANFTANSTSGPAPLCVQFTDTSLYSPSWWYWEFGDGVNSSTQHPVHVYNTTGVFSVSLIASNPAGCNNTTFHNYINATTPVLPVARFTSNVTSGSVPLSVQFTDQSTGSPANWSWSFGDGSGSGFQHPVHTYESSGLYSVNLTVTNSAGSNQTVSPNYINATTPVLPVARFTSNLTSGPVPLTVQFTDQSTGSPANWSWSFGDGSGSGLQHPVHTYESSGLYSVNLTVTNSAGSNQTVSPNYINATVPILPVARFTSNLTSGPVPLSVQFTDQSTGNPSTWNWEFGDGSSSTVQHPVHTYHSAGRYPVNLTVTNSAGSGQTVSPNYINATAPPTHYITATAGAGGSISPSGVIPVSHGGSQTFTIAPDSGYSISSVLVDGSNQGTVPSYTFSGVVSDHTIVASFLQGEYHSVSASGDDWSIIYPSGNATYPKGADPTYLTQAKPGAILQDVAVDAVSQGPVSSWTFTDISADHAISTTGVPKPGQILVLFNASVRSGKAPLNVLFWDGSSGDPTAWFWQFGDGTTSTEQHPSHSYTEPGLYTVMLRAMNNQTGGYGIWNNYISVTSGTEPQPTPTPVPGEIVPAFSASPVNGTAPLTVQYTDQSTGNPIAWLWDFGDGSSSLLQNPSHQYTQEGRYSVTLLAQNAKYAGSITKSDLISVA